MKDVCGQFKDKKVTLMGLGLLGRGVGDARFLAECGARLTVTDLKDEIALTESVEQLKKYDNITFVLGGHQEQDFTDTDLVLKAPATPLDSPYIQAAKDAGVHVTMSTALCAKYAQEHGAIIVGVTGTRGKTTVAHMIYETLRKAGETVHLGGNIRGMSTLELLSDIKEGDIVVLELDSWQLQGFAAENISPNVAVFTNLMPDHLNYYPDMDTYFADKAHIFENQDLIRGDTLIVGDTILEDVRAANPPVEPIDATPIPEEWQLSVPGVHNRENAALAREALASLGVSESDIERDLVSFNGVEGRLELVAEKGGVKIYNDNNATTPQATIAAIKSFPENDVVLIAGGTDKGVSLEPLISCIQTNVKKTVLLDPTATGTQKLKETLVDAPVAETMEKAVQEALQSVEPGDVLLFSPGFSSFGIFKNEYDRNDQFKAAVHV